jgi:hypothetical protein
MWNNFVLISFTENFTTLSQSAKFPLYDPGKVSHTQAYKPTLYDFVRNKPSQDNKTKSHKIM